MSTARKEEQLGTMRDGRGSATLFHALAVSVDELHDTTGLRRTAAEVIGRYWVLCANDAVVNIEGKAKWCDLPRDISRPTELFRFVCDGVVGKYAPDERFFEMHCVAPSVERGCPRAHVLFIASATCADAHSLRLLAARIFAACFAGRSFAEQRIVQYEELADWLADEGDEASAALGRRFWESRVLAHLAPCDLGIERSSTGSGGAIPASVICEIDADLSRHLERLDDEALNCHCLLAWQIVLQRRLGAPAVPISCYSSGRGFEQLKAVVGPLDVHLPLCLELHAATVAEQLEELRTTIAEALQWQEFAPRATDRTGAFGYDFLPREEPEGAEHLEVCELICYGEAARLKLEAFRCGSAGLVVRFLHDPDVYRTEDIAHVASQWRNVLRQLVCNAQARVSSLALDDAPVRDPEFLLAKESAVDVETLLERFEGHASRCAKRTAVVFAGGEWSYRELNERSNQLARYLLKLGVGSGETVGICMEPGPWVLCGMLASHKVGASFVMLDGGWPVLRLGEVLTDSGARAVLTEQLYLSKVADTDTEAELVSVDRDAEEIEEEGVENVLQEVLPGAAAYQVYTSGSTGRPKGVVVSQRAVSHYVSGLLEELSVGEERLEWLSLSALSADLGYTAIFGGLWSGGCIRQLPSSSSLDAEELARLLERRPVDVLKIVPGHLSALLSVSGAWRLLPRRYLLCGGEEFPKSLVEAVWSLRPELRVFNHYGPSEATVGALCGEVSRSDLDYGRVAIGRPLRYREAYLLDGEMRPVGVGVVGELYLGGEGLADGYRGCAGQTAGRFVPHPWRSGCRLYRTGDLGRYRADGRVEFLGRGDHQIKRRGYRIELGEIEQVLMRHARIRQAIVLWSEERLRCYVIGELTEAELVAYAESALIEVMRPTHWIRLEAYPLLPNGKVDRQALLALADEEAETHEPAAPRTETESLLVELWRQLLKVERVGIHDNFFRLGGESLLIIRLHAAIKKAADQDLKIVDLFQYPTVEKQAKLLDRGRGSIEESAEFRNITWRLARRRAENRTVPG